LKAGAGEPVWSPDGERIAFSAPLAIETPVTAPKVVRKLSYKMDGIGLTLEGKTQIFVVSARGGDAVQLTEGAGDAMEPSWSPDGAQLVFSRLRAGSRDGHRSDLWVLDVGTRAARQMTSSVAHVMAPAWAPNGQLVAFYGSKEEGDSRRQLWLTEPRPGTERRCTGEDHEIPSFPLGRTRPPVWSTDSSEVLVALLATSRSRIARVLLDGTTREVWGGDRQTSVLVGASGPELIAVVSSDTCGYARTSCATWDGERERLLVDLNEGWAQQRVWPKSTLRTFRGTSATTSRHGLLMTPEGRGPWPLLVDVHGGPHSYIEFDYAYHPYWHMLVSRGWAVLSLNSIGSASYGKEFSESLRGRWGEADLPEHLAAVDGLIAEGVADGERLAIAGKSYGGYLAAWAVGNTRRFRAAVCSAPVTNLESHFGTSDTGYYVDPYDMGREPSDDRDRYHRLSPIHWAHAAVTPTLILQGEEDQRCPIGQAEEFFTALMRAGHAEVEFVRYPGADHHLAESGRPSHRLDYHERIVSFLERHVCGRDPNGCRPE
jgi:dipeptidyl aminopeptidase/acylaminoacyl peptidase